MSVFFLLLLFLVARVDQQLLTSVLIQLINRLIVLEPEKKNQLIDQLRQNLDDYHLSIQFKLPYCKANYDVDVNVSTHLNRDNLTHEQQFR